MNARATFNAPTPLTDDEIVDKLEGSFGEVHGMMLVNYDNNGIDQNHDCCMSAEIVGFRIEDTSIVLNRDAVKDMIGDVAIKLAEETYREEREAL